MKNNFNSVAKLLVGSVALFLIACSDGNDDSIYSEADGSANTPATEEALATPHEELDPVELEPEEKNQSE